MKWPPLDRSWLQNKKHPNGGLYNDRLPAPSYP